MQIRWTIAALAGLLLVTVLAYAPALHGPFVFDDQRTVELNRGIHHLAASLRAPSLQTLVRGGRALTNLSFALDYRIAGNTPFVFHATNLAIHLAATLLVFTFTRRVLSLSGWLASNLLVLAVTSVFALHPLQSQSVAYVSQRSETLSSALYLGSLLLLQGWGGGRSRRARACAYLAAFLLFLLGLAAKVIVATLPAAYLLMGLLPGPAPPARPSRLRQRLAAAAPFLILVLYATTTAIFTGHGLPKEANAGFAIASLPPWRYLLTQGHVLVTYLRLVLCPRGQNLDWDFPIASGVGNPVALASTLFVLLVLTASVGLYLRSRSRSDAKGAAGRTAAFGVLWFFLLLSPTSSVVPLADVIMEHRVYLASWGLFLALAALATAYGGTLLRHGLGRRRVAATTLVVLCAALAGATYLRARLWGSELLLWSDIVAKSPGKARARLGLANAYHHAGQGERAVDECRIGLALSGAPTWIRANLHGEMAAALLSLARTPEAITTLQAGLGEVPDDGGLLGALAVAYSRQGDLPRARATAERYLRVSSGSPAALRVLGFICMQMGDYPSGTKSFEQAFRLEPAELQGALLLAAAYRTQGRPQEACRVLGSVQEPNPALQQELAEARATCGPAPAELSR